MCNNTVLLLLTLPILLKPECVYHPNFEPPSHRMDQSKGLTRMQERQINVLAPCKAMQRIKEKKTEVKSSLVLFLGIYKLIIVHCL